MQGQSYAIQTELVKPNILEVVEQYLSLRKAGKEYIGLCPFHADKNPSFSVNADKGLFHCFGCQTSGDVIRFVELIENVDFKQACAQLELNTFKPKARPHRAEAEKIACWAFYTSKRICAALRDIGDDIRLCSIARNQSYADKKLICEHEAALIRRWAILADFDDDLNDPELVLKLWAEREDIEWLLEWA